MLASELHASPSSPTRPMAPAAGRVSGLPAAEAADGRGADQREHAGAGQRPPRAHTLVRRGGPPPSGALVRRTGRRRGCGSSHPARSVCVRTAGCSGCSACSVARAAPGARLASAVRCSSAPRRTCRPRRGVHHQPGEVVDPDQQDQRDAEGLEGGDPLGLREQQVGAELEHLEADRARATRPRTSEPRGTWESVTSSLNIASSSTVDAAIASTWPSDREQEGRHQRAGVDAEPAAGSAPEKPVTAPERSTETISVRPISASVPRSRSLPRRKLGCSPRGTTNITSSACRMAGQPAEPGVQQRQQADQPDGRRRRPRSSLSGIWPWPLPITPGSSVVDLGDHLRPGCPG